MPAWASSDPAALTRLTTTAATKVEGMEKRDLILWRYWRLVGKFVRREKLRDDERGEQPVETLTSGRVRGLGKRLGSSGFGPVTMLFGAL